MPDRAYGTLHTFFDPDAWNSAVSLAYSGIEYLQQQAKAIVERAIDGLRADGLIPHHFDGEDALYVAISNSPQPGPNLFVIETAIDIACATGDIDWFRLMWNRGLRAATRWILDRFDEERGLLAVEGSLWVDVFRRRGFTLDTNAMAVRTLTRAAEAATAMSDPIASELTRTVKRIVESIGSLWADTDDHFVTSRSFDWTAADDHMDTENYLAVATGAASAEQSRRIVEFFDANPLTHPGGRGTYVSLRPYEALDCYGGNVGDSDIAMGRLWWADLLARKALRDAPTFHHLFEPVRQDLIDRVWMRERYSKTGEMVRPDGYHEYPDLIDYLIREGVYGLSIGMCTVEVAPLEREPFRAKWGAIDLSYSRNSVQLTLADDLERSVRIVGLIPEGVYEVDGSRVVADINGDLGFTMRRTFAASLISGPPIKARISHRDNGDCALNGASLVKRQFD